MTTAARVDLDDAIVRVEAEFGTLVTRIRSAARAYAAALHPELTAASCRILLAVDRCGPVHAGELAGSLGLDKSSLSRQLAILDRLELLVRSPDPADGRSSFVAVTEATAARLREMRRSDEAVVHEELRTWAPGELDQLADLLHRVNRLET